MLDNRINKYLSLRKIRENTHPRKKQDLVTENRRVPLDQEEARVNETCRDGKEWMDKKNQKKQD